MKKYVGICLFLLLVFVPFYFTFAQTSNAGFIPGNIWYSKDPFSEGDTIKIFTLIYNPDPRQLTGTVYFFDKTTFLGNKTFSVSGGGVQDISINWLVTAGDHTIFGQIQNAKFLMSDGTYVNATLSGIKTSESSRSVAKTIIPIPVTSSAGSSVDTSSGLDIQNFVKENTPTIVSTTIGNTTNAVEGFRQDVGTTLNNAKTAVQTDINNLNNQKGIESKTTKKSNSTNVSSTSGTVPSNQGIFLKPFKYTELFALSLFSSVFDNKYIFYGLIVLIIFFLVRYIVRRFF